MGARWQVSEPIEPNRPGSTNPRCTCQPAILWDMAADTTRWLHTRDCNVSIDLEIKRDYYSGPSGSYTGD